MDPIQGEFSLSGSVYYGGGYLFIEALVLFPNIRREGIPQRPIRRGTTSTSYPDKSSLRLPKALVVTSSWVPR